MEIEKPEEKKAATIDYIAAAIIGIATILGAASAYYSALWGGNMQSNYNSAITLLNDANTMYLESLSEYNKADFDDFQDDYFYVQWKDAESKGEVEDAEYFKERMTPEYANLLIADDYDAAWEEYSNAYDEKITGLDEYMDSSFVMMDTSKLKVEEGDKANTWGDKFTLVTVLFTIVLFFAGMATVTKGNKLKLIYVAAAAIMFVYSAISMFTIPFP